MRLAHFRRLAWVLVLVLLAGLAAPAFASLPDGQPKVAATLTATPKPGGQTGTQVLDVAMTRLGTGQAVTRYETELSKQLHLIAVSGDLHTFVHEHGDKPDARGHLRIPVAFPHAGLWHVYADAVPAGLGQQVMRFDLDLGGAGTPGTQPVPTPQPTGLDGTDGRYGVRFDALDLQAGQGVAPADAPTRTADAAVQVSAPCPALPLRPRPHPQPFPAPPPSPHRR